MRASVASWSNRVKAAILSAGALAAAIAAVLALLPKDSPTREASVRNLHIDRNVPLREFTVRTEDRASVANPARQALAQSRPDFVPATSRSLAAALIEARTESAGSQTGGSGGDTKTPKESSPGSDNNSASPSGSGSTNAAPSTGADTTPTTTTPTPTTTRPDSGSTGGSAGPTGTEGTSPVVDKANQKGAHICTEENRSRRCIDTGPCAKNPAAKSCGMSQAVANLSPDKAAARLAKVLHGTRLMTVGDTRQPIGVTVNFDFAAVGFSGRTLQVRWSLYDAGRGRVIPRDWLKNQVALVVKPRADNDTKSPTFWVPLPQVRGPFFIRLSAYDEDGGRLTYRDTSTFK